MTTILSVFLLLAGSTFAIQLLAYLSHRQKKNF